MAIPIGLILAAGSVAMSALGDRAIRRRQSDMRAAEDIRQKRYADQQRASLDSAVSTFAPTNQTQQLVQTGQDLGEKFTMPEANYLAPIEQQDSSPKEVKQEAARSITRAIDEGKDYARRLGRMSAYGDVNMDNNIMMGKTASTMGTMDNFARGSLDALDWELQAAQSRGTPYYLAGDLMGLGSSLYTLNSMLPRQQKPIPRSSANFGHG